MQVPPGEKRLVRQAIIATNFDEDGLFHARAALHITGIPLNKFVVAKDKINGPNWAVFDVLVIITVLSG